MHTCIVVDDQEDYQEIIAFYIEKIEGLRLLGSFCDTLSAHQFITTERPDVVFLDINILGIEGPEFINSINIKPKIIIVSGHTEQFVNSHYNIPYDAYIQKPVDLEKLLMAIAKVRVQ